MDRLLVGVEPDEPSDMARELAIEQFGPRTAAWLVRRAKRQLHRRGAVDFVLPDPIPQWRLEKLRWFFVAVEALRRRPGWSVEVETQRGRRAFRIKWLNWMMHARASRAVV